MHPSRAFSAVRLAIALAVVLAGGVRAQSPGITLTAAGGWSDEGNLTPGLTPTVLEPGLLMGLQADLYPGAGVFGVRIGGFYSRRALEESPDEYDMLTANLGFVLRTFPIRTLGSLQPYVTLTGGGTRYSAVDGAPPFGDGAFGADPVYRVHASAALGFDLPVTYRIALRLEAGDKVIFPSVGDSPDPEGFPTVDTPVILLGLQYRLALPPPRRPARRPPPVQPAPAPEAREDTAAARDTARVVQAAEEGVPEEVVEPVPAETPVGPPGFTVQVESYLGRSTARRWGGRAADAGLPVWYLDVVLGQTEASRLRIGATATEAEARDLAVAVQEAFGWSVTVEPIGDDDAVPPDAVRRTQDYLAGR